ncbi:MAG: acyl dehydratase [Bradymonadia bacterium]|jgi:acyl dehydratase
MKYYEDVVVGEVLESQPYRVTKEEIITFAKQWDPQPFHVDEAYAATTEMGLIGSGIHSIALVAKLANQTVADEPNSTICGLGWDDTRLVTPLRPGDDVRARIVVTAKRESKSRPTAGIVNSQLSLVNQRDETVVSYLSKTLMGRRPE